MSALEVNRDVWREHVEQQSPEICARRHGLFELIDEAVRVKVALAEWRELAASQSSQIDFAGWISLF